MLALSIRIAKKYFSKYSHPQAHKEFKLELENRRDAYYEAQRKVDNAIKENKQLERTLTQQAKDAQQGKKLSNKSKSTFQLDLHGHDIAKQLGRMSELPDGKR